MIFQDEAAIRAAKAWKVPRSTMRRWQKRGLLPDCRVFNQPLDKAGLATEQKLIRLVESGWLKARPISESIGSGDRINAMLTSRRYPNDPRFHVKYLRADEIKQLKILLDRLTRETGMLLYLSSLTPDPQPYSDVVQDGIRALLRRKSVSSANVRSGMDSRQGARFWGFMRGGVAKREDLDIILDRLKVFVERLSA